MEAHSESWCIFCSLYPALCHSFAHQRFHTCDKTVSHHHPHLSHLKEPNGSLHMPVFSRQVPKADPLPYRPSSTQLPLAMETDPGSRFTCEWHNLLSQPFCESVLWIKKCTPAFLANNHFYLAFLWWYSRYSLKVSEQKIHARLLVVNWCQDCNPSAATTHAHNLYALQK